MKAPSSFQAPDAETLGAEPGAPLGGVGAMMGLADVLRGVVSTIDATLSA
jgi:hypothetical protein